jgi:hypothetical protein
MTDVSSRDVQDPATATEPKRADSSLGELFSQMTTDLGDLFRKEVELAKVETREQMQRSVKAIGAMAAAGVGGLLFLWFASVALAELLDQGINRALAFLIVAVVWAVIAGVLFAAGRSRLRQVQPLPETTATLKEDVQWAKTLKS